MISCKIVSSTLSAKMQFLSNRNMFLALEGHQYGGRDLVQRVTYFAFLALFSMSSSIAAAFEVASLRICSGRPANRAHSIPKEFSLIPSVS